MIVADTERHPWLAKSARFEESKHPRDGGKFSSTQGARAKPKTDMRSNPDLDAAWNAPSPSAPKPASGDIRRNTALDAFMDIPSWRKPDQRRASKPTEDPFADAMSGQDAVKQQAHKAAQSIGSQFAMGKPHKVSAFIGALRQHPPEVIQAICQKAGIVKTDNPKQVVQKFYAAFGGKVRVSFPGKGPPPLPKRGNGQPPLPKRSGAQPPPLPGKRRKSCHPWLRKGFDESKHPRADDGRFGSGAGHAEDHADHPTNVARDILHEPHKAEEHLSRLHPDDHEELRKRVAALHESLNPKKKTERKKVEAPPEHVDALRQWMKAGEEESGPEHVAKAREYVASIAKLPKDTLRAIATEAGIEAIFPSASKEHILQRITNRITVLHRARDRAEV